MRVRKHGLQVLFALVAAVLIIASASSAAPLAQTATPKGFLTEAYYSGSYTHTYKGSPEGSPKNPGTETIQAHYTFSESVSLYTPDDPNAKNGLGSGDSQNNGGTIKLSGEQSRTYSPDAHQQDCSATLSARGGTAASFGGQQPPVHIVANGTEGIVEVSGEPAEIPPVLRVDVSSGDPAACGNGVLGPYSGIATCNTRITNMTDPEWTAGDRGFDNPPYGFLHAVAKINPLTPTYTHHYHVDDTSPPNGGCAGTDNVTADSTLIVNISRANGPPPRSSYETGVAKLEAKVTAKENAQSDLKDIFPGLVYYCGATALGGAGLTLAGAGPAAAPLAIGGAGMFMAAAPDCKPLAQAAATYVRIIHDPPLAHVDQLATAGRSAVRRATAHCPHWQGQPARFCTTLTADLTTLLNTATTLRNVVTALATTVGRESSAVKQHNTSAAKLQDQHLAKMNPEGTAAVRAFLAASARFAALLHGAGIRASLSQAQEARAIRVLIARLGRAGVDKSALQQLAGNELAPQALDVLGLLAGHFAAPPTVPTTGNQPTITSVTFAGGPRNPSVVVHGTNLGTQPRPNPTGHPSGLNGCPTAPGDSGYDYGTSLYLANAAQTWAGGRYRPDVNEMDCLDLLVTKFTSTEVEFDFGGPFYKRFYPKFELAPGLQVQVVVNGATYDTTVKYG